MPTLKKILNSDIRYECGDSGFTRGMNYYQKGMVLTLSVVKEDERSVELITQVKGSLKNPYQQHIRLDWSSKFNKLEIEGECSCPVGFNCKHVAAACLSFQSQKLGLTTTHSTVSKCFTWLDGFNESSFKHTEAVDFLAYVLAPQAKKSEFVVELQITKPKKSGGLAKGRVASLNSLRYSYSHSNALQPKDEEIIRLLLALNSTYRGEPIIKGALGQLVLLKMLETGHLFFKNLEEPPLHLGEARVLAFLWSSDAGGNFELNPQITPQAQLILTDPPFYLDSSEHCAGPLQMSGLSYDKLEKMISAPVIPAELAEEFSFKLAYEHPELPLPAPKRIEFIQYDDLSPIPRLELLGSQTNSNTYIHFLKVTFDYGDHNLSAANSKEVSALKSGKELIRIKRNLEKEEEAIQVLESVGFERTEILGNQDFYLYSPDNQSKLASASRWSQFVEQVLPDLLKKGWRIEFEESYKLNFQNPEGWEAEISETNSDWFDMHFNVTINGQSMPLLPLILPVLEFYTPDTLPEIVPVPFGDHGYLNLAAVQIKPFLNVIYELFNSSNLNDDGSLSLSRYDASSLAYFEEHNYGLFSLKGGEALRQLGQKLKNFRGIQDVAPPAQLNAELRPYQRQGLNWLQFLREYEFGGILADDMGLGKTVQTLAHLLLEKEQGRLRGPSLIVAPTSLMGNWRRETQRFTKDLSILILQGSDRRDKFAKIPDYDLILTTYPLLTRDESFLLKHDFYYLVLDEAQIVKNPLAKASRIVRKIKAKHRLCLTGTPMENHLGELWAQFDFLMPGFLGNKDFFRRIYRTPIEVHADAQQRARLSRRIEPFMLRRTKTEVASELPPKTEIIRSIPLHDKQAALYESIRLSMERKIRDTIAQKGLARSHITILDALLKLRQTCCDPRTLSLKEAQKINQSAKLDLLMELIPELLEEGRKILVFSQFTRMISLIESELNARKIAYSKLIGQTRNRDEVIADFTSGKVNVFLISLKAGGVGLNLTEADAVIIYDPWWNPAVENQAADRTYRIGQDKPVFVYKLITENTVEEKILALQERKKALADRIYGSHDQVTFNLTADDLTELFKPAGTQ